MGQCLQKERIGSVEKNGTKRGKLRRSKHRKNSPQELAPEPKRRASYGKRSSQEIFGNVAAAENVEVSFVPAPAADHHVPVPETYTISYRSSETSNASAFSSAKRIRMEGSDITIGSEVQSPVGSDEHNDSLASRGMTSPRDKRRMSPMRRMFNSPKLAPRVLFKSPLPKHLSSSFRREKNNSTSSLYIADTINSPNVDEVIRCMSIALLYHIKDGVNRPDLNIGHIFSEKAHPLTRELLDLVNVPDVQSIFRYVNLIFRVQKLPSECAILCLAYIERILSTGKIALNPENWRRIVFGSILIATKVWEDESVWNVDFLDLFPLLTLVDLNNLENRFMELLQFNVLIVGSEYAKYYFELRALSAEESFPLEPLNKETQAKLEERAQKTNREISKFTSSGSSSSLRESIKRARSVDYFDPKSPPAVLH
eukprot:TRINITY_DN3161_c0_g1_i2.p1 TRINITY_DN3161_c0_g1~~TRINITY_DN3161_c0_g1_i2.p1  ORF type:complete len:426 (-),score=86.93 TRINITY_DN3161_c0_g1_i2:92-1369(-)